MTRPDQHRSWIFATSLSAATAAFALTIVLMPLAATQPAQAQSFKVLYSFTGRADGRHPSAGVIIGPDGNLYGTSGGGTIGGACGPSGGGGCGTIFQLRDTQSGWALTTLYAFRGGTDGVSPGRLTFGHDGSLYGSTAYGGGGGIDYWCANTFGCGTIFKLRPEQNGTWIETVLYRFQGVPDGETPNGAPVFDGAGNLYGTTMYGGNNLCLEGDPCGMAYQLTPANGGWNETVIWNFGTGNEGFFPTDVIFDRAGNLYGAAWDGGNDAPSGPLMGVVGTGTVFELTRLGDSWTARVLHDFNSQPGPSGQSPRGGLIFDQSGNLYGTTYYGGSGNVGTVFELSPAGGNWLLRTLYDFAGGRASGPYGSLVMNQAGNLYGIRGYLGTVYQLNHSHGGWTYTSLHDFSGSDGEYLAQYLTLDASGNLYGTTTSGGAYGYGVVFEITP